METKYLIVGSALCLCLQQVQAQNINFDLTTSGTTGTTSINAPAGYSYSGAAPVAGTTWNTFGTGPAEPSGTPAGTYTLYNTSALVDSLGNSLSETLTVSLTQPVASTHGNPSNASGENTIQPGGVMAGAWRNYNNSSGFYYTFTIAGLSDSTPYDLYVEGGTGTSGQGAGIVLAAGNVLGANPGSGTTANTTANYNGAYGSLFTSTDGGTTFQLLPAGSSWLELQGQSDASGDFSFNFTGSGSAAYLNGFQLAAATPVPEPGVAGMLISGLGLLAGVRRFQGRR